MAIDCPQDHVLAEFVDGRVDPPTAAAVRDHLDACDSCADVIAGSVAGAREIVGSIGRYLVLERIGAGGMGDVYAAHDPELERAVAIKVHRGPVDALIREARAAARVDHPNVVRVYDAGRIDGGRAFVAMELVDGATLRDRIEARRAPWRQTAAMMVAAGRGLAAAHAAGLVHGDFKPDNVLVADDGRVLVTDFGLARREGETAGDGGAIAGTPGYLAPELLAGHGASAASDQFAYAVTFHEVLFGVRPFAGRDLVEQLAAIRAGRVRTGRRAAPRWLRRALRRAMATDPRARHAGMAALLRDVERGLRRRAVALAAGAVAIAALAGWWLAPARDPGAACERAGDPVAAVWNPARAARLRDAIGAGGSPLRDAAPANVVRALDDHASRVASAMVGACDATHRRHVQSPALLDRRMACFERVLIDMDALARAIPAAGTEGLARGWEAVAALPPPSRCDGAVLLAAGDDAVLAPAHAALAPAARQLAAARALLATGQLDRARDVLRAGVPTGTDRAARALSAEWHLVTGRVLQERMDDTAARAELEQALWAAEEIGDTRLAVDAIVRLIPLIGSSDAAAAEAGRWARLAEAMLARRATDPDRRAAIELALARFHADRQDPPRAVAHAERALVLVTDATPVQPAHVLLNLGRALKKAGRLAEAEVYVRQAARRFEQILGPRHPIVSVALMNLGAILVDGGRDREAIDVLERALDVSRRAYGEDHVNNAFLLTDLALARSHLDDPAAVASYRAALALFEASPDHSHQVGVVLLNLSSLLIRRGDAAGALEIARRSLERNLAAHGADHMDTALSRINLSEALELGGQHAVAVAEAEQAVTALTARLPADHRYRAQALARLGLARHAAGHRDAERSLAVALAALEESGAPERDVVAVKRALSSFDEER